jgi:hypothetical protein
MAWQLAPEIAGDLPGRGECFRRTLRVPQLTQHDAAVDVRLHIAWVELQRALERFERPLRVADEMIGKAHHVKGIGKGTSVVDELFQEMDAPVVVLQLEPLTGESNGLRRTGG